MTMELPIIARRMMNECTTIITPRNELSILSASSLDVWFRVGEAEFDIFFFVDVFFSEKFYNTVIYSPNINI